MGFAEAWKKIQIPTPEDKLDAIRRDDISVHRVENAKKGQAAPAPIHRTPEIDWYDDAICMVLDNLNEAGVEVMNFPEEVRRRAHRLFDEFSEAVTVDDMPRFWKALMAWRDTWFQTFH